MAMKTALFERMIPTQSGKKWHSTWFEKWMPLQDFGTGYLYLWSVAEMMEKRDNDHGNENLGCCVLRNFPNAICPAFRCNLNLR